MGLFLRNFTKKPFSLSEEQQLYFLKRLFRSLNHGYSLLGALEIIKWEIKLEESANIIIDSLQNGCHLDEAFESANFHSTIISYLYFVRFNGNITTNIQKCVTMFEHRIKHIQKFKQVIRYPIVLCTFFLLLLFFMKTSVLPSFITIFQASNESSKAIFISITAIDILTTVSLTAFILIVIGGLFWKFYTKEFPIERQLMIYEKIPVYRHLLRLQNSYYFAAHLSMFLKTGMSLKEIINQMKAQNKLPILAYYAELMLMELQQGHYVQGLLQHLPFIDRQLALLFEKNNNVNDLEQDLDIYALFLTETIEAKIMKMITYIQPIVFTVLAIMIVFIYLSLMWPMFQLIQTV